MDKDVHTSLGNQSPPSDPKTAPPANQINITMVVSFVILFALWVVLSGRLDAAHLTMGFISSAFVAASSGRLMFTSHRLRGIFGLWIRFAGYIPWLIYQIFLANLHVMYLVFHPKMMDLINPEIIQFDSRLSSDYSRTLLANSITLTPGTITVDVTALGRFSVHCIDDPSGQSLPGDMEKKIATVFKE